MDWDTLEDSGELISKNMRQMSMQGHASQFSMNWKGEKLSGYSILAFNHGDVFNTTWMLHPKLIVWPGSCEMFSNS